jgi:hypothetical protein
LISSDIVFHPLIAGGTYVRWWSNKCWIRPQIKNTVSVGFQLSHLKSVSHKFYGLYSKLYFVSITILLPIVQPFLTPWFWLRSLHLLDQGSNAHSLGTPSLVHVSRDPYLFISLILEVVSCIRITGFITLQHLNHFI